jgi:nucleoside-diphosphate-sugar epimerase
LFVFLHQVALLLCGSELQARFCKAVCINYKKPFRQPWDSMNKLINQTAQKTVLITGASGFIGSHLVTRSLAEGYRVKALVRKGNAAIEPLRSRGVDVVVGDLCDFDAVLRSVHGCDLVFHVAAITSDWGEWKEFRAVNVEGTRSVCRACIEENGCRMVYLSSIEVFDHARLERLDEGMPFRARGERYSDTKLGGTAVVREYQKQGFDATIIYPSMVYGPLDRTIVPQLADAIRRGLLFYWERNVRLPLIYIDNLVDLMMLAAITPAASGEDYLACDGNLLTFEDLCTRIAGAIGSRAPRVRLPKGFTCILARSLESFHTSLNVKSRPLITMEAVELLSSRVMIDTTKARHQLGWAPKVSLEDGLRRTFEWLVSVPPEKWKTK